MHENKHKFELAAKIIGLILVIGGICMALDAILIAFNVKDTISMFKNLSVPYAGKQTIQAFNQIERDIWKSVYFVLLFEGMIPIMIGMYLMKPNNIFSEYSYPSPNKPHEERETFQAGSFSHSDQEMKERPFVIGELKS